MGFFSFLFSKEKPPVAEPQDEPKMSIPTIAVSHERKDAFDESFHLYMSQLGCFSNDEIEQMLDIIKSTKHGFVDQYSWQNEIYDEFFKHRTYIWPMLEEWRDILAEHGAEWLSKSYQKEEENNDMFFTAAAALKIVEIHNILKSAGIAFKKSAKKDDLISLLNNSVSREWLEKNSEAWSVAMRKAVNQRVDFKYEEYRLLLKTIRAAAEILYSMSNSARAGVAIGHYMFRSAGVVPKEFSREVVRKEPGKVPPLFPGDVTTYRSDLASFSPNAIGKFPELRLHKDDE